MKMKNLNDVIFLLVKACDEKTQLTEEQMREMLVSLVQIQQQSHRVINSLYGSASLCGHQWSELDALRRMTEGNIK
jgi:hypothetical protein